MQYMLNRKNVSMGASHNIRLTLRFSAYKKTVAADSCKTAERFPERRRRRLYAD
jgi:hypothetical protein